MDATQDREIRNCVLHQVKKVRKELIRGLLMRAKWPMMSAVILVSAT